LDADAITGQVGDLLVSQGVVRTWNEVLQPVLVSIGVRWIRAGIDVEHVLSEAILDALRAYRAFLPRSAPGRPVLLACARDEQHTLPLHALAAGLAEQRVPLRLLGGRVPALTLSTAARRTGAGAIFLWRHCVDDESVPAVRAEAPSLASAQDAVPAEADDLAALAQLTRSRPARRLVVGGRYWQQAELPPGARYAPDLGTGIQLLTPALM
jgi:hypothetical protein